MRKETKETKEEIKNMLKGKIEVLRRYAKENKIEVEDLNMKED